MLFAKVIKVRSKTEFKIGFSELCTLVFTVNPLYSPYCSLCILFKKLFSLLSGDNKENLFNNQELL